MQVIETVKNYFSGIIAGVNAHHMSIPLRVVLVIASLLVVAWVLSKIRKKQLHIDDSLYWIISSCLLVVVSVFPQIAFFFSEMLGIHDATNFVFLVVIFIVLIKLFKLAIELSVQKQRLNTLVQKLALANEKIEANKKKLNEKESEEPEKKESKE